MVVHLISSVLSLSLSLSVALDLGTIHFMLAKQLWGCNSDAAVHSTGLGSANSYSYVPQMGSKLTADMDFGERITNTIVGTVDSLVEYFISDPAANKLRAK